MTPHPKPSKRYGEYVRKIKCDQWDEGGVVGNDKGLLRHRDTGQTVAYGLHDGGNDWNGPRNFAAEVQRICGCRLIEARGRKSSRKSFSTIDPEVEASRAKHAQEYEERQAAEQRREAEIRRARDSALREREIRELMRPGWNR